MIKCIQKWLGPKEPVSPTFVPNASYCDKPWGHEELLFFGKKYCCKILHIKAGHRLSLQYHREKEETMVLLKGEVKLLYSRVETLGENLDEDRMESVILNEYKDTVHLPAGNVHRLCAIQDSDILEVSTPYLTDIVRLADDYGR